MRLRSILVTIILLVPFLAIVGFSAFDHLTKTSPNMARKMNQPIPVQTVAVEQRTLLETIGASGEVRPITVVSLTSNYTGRIQEVAVDIGDKVSQGDMLIQFDSELAEAALRRAQSAVHHAAAELKRAKQQLQRTRAIYKQGLASAMLAVPQSMVDHASAELARAEDYLRRITVIYEQKLLPKVEVESAQAAVELAQVRYREAQEKLLRAKKDLHSELEKAQAEAEEAHVRYHEAQEKLAQAKQERQNTTLASPVSGIVIERLINAGENARLHQHVLTIGRIDHVLVEAKVPEDRVGAISPQQSAVVTFNAFPNEIMEGEVVKVKPMTDVDTKTFLVYVKVGNPEGKLIPGLTGFVRIKRPHGGLAIPSIALINPTGLQESTVFVVENGALAKLRKVKVGVIADGMTEIRDGLAEGEQVIVVGQLALRDGDQVRIGDEFRDLKTQYAQERSHR